MYQTMIISAGTLYNPSDSLLSASIAFNHFYTLLRVYCTLEDAFLAQKKELL